MQIHGMQRPHSGRTQEHLRRGHENRHEGKNETHGQEEERPILQSHLTGLITF